MFAFVSAPIDTLLSPIPHAPLACSLADNGIGAAGAFALADVLQETKITTLQFTAPDELECAIAPERSLSCQRRFLRSLANAPFPCPIALHPALRYAAWTWRTGVGRARAPISPPHTTTRPPHRLDQGNRLDDYDKQVLSEAAGSGVKIEF